MSDESVEDLIPHAQKIHDELNTVCVKLNKLLKTDEIRACEFIIHFEEDLGRTIDMFKKQRLKLPTAKGIQHGDEFTRA